MAANKTDANDADGLAQLAEVGFFRAVRVKGFHSMLTRTLVVARTRLVRITTELSNQIRGVMKTFGLLVPAGKGSTFEKNVRSLLADQDGLASLCFQCWKPGVAFASAPPNSDANSDASWFGMRARVTLAASSCRFPASVRSPQPPLPQLLRSPITSGNPDLLARGSA